MNSYLNFIYQNKKLFYLIIFLVFLIMAVSVMLMLQRSKPSPFIPPVIYQSSPSPSPYSTFVPQKDYQQLFNDDAKDLHWLNNQEIAYTYFDSSIKQRALAKINISGTAKSNLIQDASIKMSEIFWSADNNLLIFDYGNPYTTYLYNTQTNNLKKTTLNGYGYSWSPLGDSIFFSDLSDNTKPAKIYNIKDNSYSPVNINNLPNFIASYWSAANKVLLYNFDSETGHGEVNILDLTTNSVNRININNLVFPSWSPSGKRLAYASDGGIHTVSDNNSTVAYATSTESNFLSYSWLDDDNMIIFDGGKTTNQFTLVSLNLNTEKTVLKEITTAGNQRAQFANSPDSNTLAIALEKNGLWIIRKEFIIK